MFDDFYNEDVFSMPYFIWHNRNLSRSQKTLYPILKDFIRYASKPHLISNKLLASANKCSLNTINRDLNKLEEMGFIKRRFKDGYRLITICEHPQPQLKIVQ